MSLFLHLHTHAHMHTHTHTHTHSLTHTLAHTHTHTHTYMYMHTHTHAHTHTHTHTYAHEPTHITPCTSQLHMAWSVYQRGYSVLAHASWPPQQSYVLLSTRLASPISVSTQSQSPLSDSACRPWDCNTVGRQQTNELLNNWRGGIYLLALMCLSFFRPCVEHGPITPPHPPTAGHHWQEVCLPHARGKDVYI